MSYITNADTLDGSHAANTAGNVPVLDANAELDPAILSVTALDGPIAKYNAATGTAFGPERVNDDNLGTFSTSDTIGEYSEILFPIKSYISEYRYYGQSTQLGTGTYKIQHLLNESWIDNTVDVPTRVNTWSDWLALTTPIYYDGIRIIATSIDPCSNSANNNYLTQIEFRG